MKKLLLTFVLFLLIASPTYANKIELPDPGLTPDSPLYFLDTFIEQVKLAFTSKENKAKVKLNMAKERLAEAKQLKNEDKKSNEAFNQYKEMITEIKQTKPKSKDIKEELKIHYKLTKKDTKSALKLAQTKTKQKEKSGNTEKNTSDNTENSDKKKVKQLYKEVKSAYKNKNWTKFLDKVNPKERSDKIGEMFTEAMLATNYESDKDEYNTQQKKLIEISKKIGTYDSIKKKNSFLKQVRSKAKSNTNKLSKADQAKTFGKLVSLLESNSNQEIDRIIKLGDLVSVSINGNEANYLIKTKEGRERETAKKINGKWYWSFQP